MNDVMNSCELRGESMSFIRTVSRSLIDASLEGQKVVRHLSKLARLNITLKFEREKQKSIYKEIGAHVHHDKVTDVSGSAKMRDLREKLQTQERNIARLVEKINLLKRINSCSYCGHVAREEFKYCPRCSRPRK